MAQTKAQKKRAIEGKKYYVAYKKPTKSGKLGKDHVSKWLNYNDAIKYAKENPGSINVDEIELSKFGSSNTGQ